MTFRALQRSFPQRSFIRLKGAVFYVDPSLLSVGINALSAMTNPE
jgi:hypothetical protein